MMMLEVVTEHRDELFEMVFNLVAEVGRCCGIWITYMIILEGA